MSWRSLLRPGFERLEAYRVVRPEGYAYFDANESPYGPDPALRRRVAELAASIDLNRYPDVSARPVREALGRHLGVDPECLVVGNGSDEVLAMLMTAFAAPRPGRAAAGVAYPVPTFTMYGLHALALGHQPLELPTRPDFTVDEEAVLAVLKAERPNLFFLARPNNPTGTLWPRSLVERAAEDEDLLVVVDEAYGPFAREDALDLVASRPNVVVMRTFSKVGFAALRVGYAVANPEVARELDKARLPYNLDALSQAIAVEVITRWDALVAPVVEGVISERERLSEALGALGLAVVPSRANLLLVRSPAPDETYEALRRRGILVRNLHREGTPLAGCLRITVGTAQENDRLVQALGEIQK